ncbi:hypothetical protein GF345_06620, partial [Candidatus Woesearchaeota archaeon]|nr:hypothetical protein [Candidatus Woesearchaeota archaeon]
AVSTDFPVEKIGTYTVNAVLTLENLSVDISTSFEVIASDSSDDNTSESAEDDAEPSLPDKTPEPQTHNGSDFEDIKDDNDGVIGRKITDEPDFETVFTSAGVSGDYFIIEFYHNSTTSQPIWIEGDIEYNLSSLFAEPEEMVRLAIPLKNYSSVPKFRLHVGAESEVFEFEIIITIDPDNGQPTEVINASDVVPSELVPDIDVDFSSSDISESWDSEGDESFPVTFMEKEGVRVEIKGAAKQDISRAYFRKGALHIDPIPIRKAEIRIPHKPLPRISNARLYVKEEGSDVFVRAEPYEKGNERYNTLNITPTHYVFNVEHFSDYFVNTTNYERLVDCMVDNNNTNDKCVVNEGGHNETFNKSYSFYITGVTIANQINNTFIDFNYSVMNRRQLRIGNGNNISLSNLIVDGKNIEAKNVYAISTTNLSLINITSIQSSDDDYFGDLKDSNITGYTTNLTAFHMTNSDNVRITDYKMFDCDRRASSGRGCFHVGLGNNMLIDGFWINITTQALVGLGSVMSFHGSENATVSNGYVSAEGLGYDGISFYGVNHVMSNITIEDSLDCIDDFPDSPSMRRTRIINSTFKNCTGNGILIDEGFSHNNSIINCTFDNAGASEQNTGYFATYSNLCNGTVCSDYVVFADSAGATTTFVTADNTNITQATGANNFAKLFIYRDDANTLGKGAGENHTIYAEEGYPLDCPGIVATYGGRCFYARETDSLNNTGVGGDYQYHPDIFNESADNLTVKTGGTSPANLTYEEPQTQNYNPIKVISKDTNITGNTFHNLTGGVGLLESINITSGALNTKLWLNNFYYAGITDESTSTSLCVNNEGNFYEESVTVATGDCGPANITTLVNRTVFDKRFNNSFDINWTNQSSQYDVTYTLLYTNSTGVYNITPSSGNHYNFSLDRPRGDYTIRLIPYDGTFNATNQILSFNLTIDNEYVCSDFEETCEYNNLSGAIKTENSTSKLITLFERNRTYVSPAGSYYNMSINMSLTNQTLDCNNTVFIGNRTYSLLVDSENSTVKDCTFMNYSYAISILETRTNITNNTIYDSGSYDIHVASSENNIWFNSLYSKGINDSGTSSYCIDSKGNVYAEAVPVSAIGNGTGGSGTTIGGDCGIANLTIPSGSAFTGHNISINWTNSTEISTDRNITYHLYYSNDSMATWNPINATSTLNYNWSILYKNDGDYYIKLVPDDGNFNLTNETSPEFTLDRGRNLSFINQTWNQSGAESVVNETEAVPENENLTIRARVSSTLYNIESVWIKVWDTVRGAGTTLWEGVLSLVSGTVSDGVWAVDMLINKSFVKSQLQNYTVNYTIYANESTSGYTMRLDGNFTVRPNNKFVCNDTNICEYNNITGALIAENSTNATISIIESGIHSITSGYSFNKSMPGSLPVIQLNTTNITLDCNGAEFLGYRTGTGIMIQNFNLATIRECNISNYTHGIIVDNSNYTNITLNTIAYSSGYDMNITSTSNRVRSWSNSFYGEDVTSLSSSNIFCYNGDPALDLDPSIMLAYNFQEQDGNVTYDKSINQYHGGLYPDEASGPQRIRGRFFKGIEFDGGDDYVHAGNFSFPTPATIIMWVKPGSHQDSQSAVGSFPDSTDEDYIRYILWMKQTYYVPDESWFVMLGNGTDYQIASSGQAFDETNFPTGSWAHIAVTYNGSAVRFYKDGFLINTVVQNTTVANDSQPLSIGKMGLYTINPTYFNGSMDSVIIYNRTLKHSEILDHYTRSKGTGNFYRESSNRSNIEYNLDDCGISSITYPTQYLNFTGTLNVDWTDQKFNTGTTTYYLSYTNDSGINWYGLATTSSSSYAWGISGLPDGDDYMLSVVPYDGRFNGTNASSQEFGIHNSLPEIVFLNQTDLSNVIITESNPIRGKETARIAVNVSGKYTADTVWLDVWNKSEGSPVVWRGLFTKSGPSYLKNDTWVLEMTINESFPESGYVNYSIYANGTLNNTGDYSGNISLLDNDLICANSTACEFSSLAAWLAGENNTNNTLVFSQANQSYTGASGIYNMYSSPGRAVFEFAAEGVSLDCQGATFLGSYGSYGALINQSDRAKLIDCRFGRYSTGINITDSDWSNISISSSFDNSEKGISMHNADNASVYQFNSSNNTLSSIRISSSNSSNITESYSSYSDAAGINISSSGDILLSDLDIHHNSLGAVYVDALSSGIIISDSSIKNSTSASLMMISGDRLNITGNSFQQAPSGYVDLNLSSTASYNNIWLNNLYSQGVIDSGNFNSFCIEVDTHLNNRVFTSTIIKKDLGNYYSSDINSNYIVTDGCGSLDHPYGDLDNDGYYSFIRDCNDSIRFSYPYAPEECDGFDNDCDGSIDEEACEPERFPSAGSGSSGGAAIAGYSPESLSKEQNIDENPVVVLYRGETMTFDVKGEKQTIKLNKVYFEKVNFTIHSLNMDFIVFENESMMFDLDNDGVEDLNITLSAIKQAAAVFDIKELRIVREGEGSISPEPEVAEGIEPEEAAPEEQMPSRLSQAGKSIIRYAVMATAILSLIILISAGSISYFRFMGNVSKAEDYIRSGLVKGISRTMIRRKLIDAGWEPQIVDSLIDMESKAFRNEIKQIRAK